MGTIYWKESRIMCGVGLEIIEMIELHKELQRKSNKKKNKKIKKNVKTKKI